MRQLALGLDLPLIEPVGRDQTAATLERLSKRRLLGNRLDSGVDVAGRHLAVLRPEREQPPLEGAQDPLVVVLGDGVDRVGRRHVVRRLQLLGLDDVGAKELGVDVGRLGLNKAATHGGIVPPGRCDGRPSPTRRF